MKVVVLVHPADFELAELKAEAAKLGADVVASPNVPRGMQFLTRQPEPEDIAAAAIAAALAAIAIARRPSRP